jgi:hypothetical protein
MLRRGSPNHTKQERLEARSTGELRLPLHNLEVRGLQDILRRGAVPAAATQCPTKRSTMVLFELLLQIRVVHAL